MLNKVMLIGNVGKDPDIKALPSGTLVANFSLATTYRYSKDGKAEEQTEWHNVQCYGKLAENIDKFVKKGLRVYIEGRLKTDKWEKDGQKHSITRVLAEQVKFLSPVTKKEAQVTDEESQVPPNEDDVPF